MSIKEALTKSAPDESNDNIFSAPTKNGITVVGDFIDGYLIKKVNSQKHYFKIFRGYGISQSHIERLQKLNARGVKLIDETGRTYTALLSVILSKGIHYQKEIYEPQVILPLKFWNVQDPSKPSLFEV